MDLIKVFKHLYAWKFMLLAYMPVLEYKQPLKQHLECGSNSCKSNKLFKDCMENMSYLSRSLTLCPAIIGCLRFVFMTIL